MIKLKLSLGGDTLQEQEFEIVSGELLDQAVERAISDVPLNGFTADDLFNVLVNGHLMDDADLWKMTALKEGDQVLITPKIKSGDSGQILKSAIIIAVTAVASVYLTPAGGATIASALGVAAVTIGATLLLNAIIPPPNPGGSDLGIAGGYEDSQMYSLTGQSNQTKRFEIVPKVYGQHRLFPTVAAAPYAELEVDPETGKLIQFLYCIYDFGLAPVQIGQLYIGDTPLSPDNFSDYYTHLVDPNKPFIYDVENEPWTAICSPDFRLYKGVNEGVQLAINIDGNQSAGDPQDTWQAIRDTSPNTDGVDQEIILNFVCPNGLYGYNAYGSRGPRQIEMEIQFAPVGTEDWHDYNDMTKVTNFSAVGGQTNLFEFTAQLADDGVESGPYYESRLVNVKNNPGRTFDPVTPNWRMRQLLRRGQNKILVVYNESMTVGQPVFLNGTRFIGNIAAINTVANPANREIVLDRNVPVDGPYVKSWRGTSTYVIVPAPPTPGGKIQYSYTWESASSLGDGGYDIGYIRSSGNGPGRARIQREDQSPVYATFRFTPNDPGQYRVRVQRISTYSALTTTVADKLTWNTITTRFDRAVIQTAKRHVFLELKIKATGQLNGTISNLSAQCDGIVDVYDPDTEEWIPQASRNPAWVFADLLTGAVNKKALSKDRLHLPSLLEWADYCDSVPLPPPSQEFSMPRFECNFVLDYNTTLQGVLNQVAGAAQASLNIIDGKYGVLIDQYRSTPVQIFTPKNSRDFQSTRNYGPRPDGVKVKYIDPNANWQVSEAIAYDDGFDASNAVELEEMTSFACTNYEQAWRFGRYMIAQNKLRQETISILVDFEHLVCTRGDFVQITQDVMRVGGTPARVKTVVGNEITINDSLEIDPELDYGYVYRAINGEIKTSTLTALTPNSFELDGDIPDVGDLIVVGVVGQVVYDCLVKSISPNDDMSANLTLVEKADAIYDYESSDTLPEYDPQISLSSNPNINPPTEVVDLTVADSGHDCNAAGNAYIYFIDLTWLPPDSVYELFSIFVDYGNGYDIVADTRNTTYRYIVDEDFLGNIHNFKVVAVSATGRKLDLGSVGYVSSTPVRKSTPPSDVERLDLNVTNEVLQLNWPQIPDCDSKEYLLKYSPDLDGTWETSTQLTRVDRRTTSASVQARTGTYLIKAVDFNDNSSDNAATAITTIPNLFNLNIIETVSESPDFDGSFDRTQKLGDSVILNYEVPGVPGVAQFYSEGYYYFKEIVDLGDIYTARLQSSIQADGYAEEDLMSNWETLDSVLLMSNSAFGDWNVETQYRASNELNVIEQWVTLSSISAMNEGAVVDYTPWRTFYMGDVTGRVFQFRLRLTSNTLTVSPRVYDGTIKVDMPDRVDSFNNLTTSASVGLEVEYEPAFKGPSPSPNVQVSIDDAETGDYWAFDYKTLEGLSIRVFDKNDIQVVRQIDIAVKGYGHKHTNVI